MGNRKTGRHSNSQEPPDNQDSSRESISPGKVSQDVPGSESLLSPGVPRAVSVRVSQAVAADAKRRRNYDRITVELPQEQHAALAAIGKREHLARAELVRRAVAEFLAHHTSAPEGAAFGLWRTRQRDGLEYQMELRSEWDI